MGECNIFGTSVNKCMVHVHLGLYCFGGVYMGFRIPKALISILSVTRVLQVAEGF